MANKNVSVKYEKNTSYLFVPFCLEDRTHFNTVIDILEHHDQWTPVADEVRYMFRYVSGKLDRSNPDACRCFHYRLSEAGMNTYRLVPSLPYHTFSTNTEPPEQFGFRFLEVHLFCFRTSVGVLAFRIHYDSDDPYRIADAQYYIKKAYGNNIVSSTLPDFSFNLKEKSAEILQPIHKTVPLNLFFYMNNGTERVNMLTYLDLPEQEDYNRALFYLRRGFRTSYPYTIDKEQDRKEIYHAMGGATWGISPEAAICLVNSQAEPAHQNFIQNTFFKNFNSQYLYMYVLLLHQKYTLYLLLTQVDQDTEKSLQSLQDYKKQLDEFNADYVFSCITEVPQYQNLYQRMVEAFSLKPMYEDVNEPLIALSEERIKQAEIQRMEQEKAQKQRDLERKKQEEAQKGREDKMNNALALLSILGIFSALVDSYQFVQEVGTRLYETPVRFILQILCMICILILAIPVLSLAIPEWISRIRRLFKKLTSNLSRK